MDTIVNALAWESGVGASEWFEFEMDCIAMLSCEGTGCFVAIISPGTDMSPKVVNSNVQFEYNLSMH